MIAYTTATTVPIVLWLQGPGSAVASEKSPCRNSRCYFVDEMKTLFDTLLSSRLKGSDWCWDSRRQLFHLLEHILSDILIRFRPNCWWISVHRDVRNLWKTGKRCAVLSIMLVTVEVYARSRWWWRMCRALTYQQEMYFYPSPQRAVLYCQGDQLPQLCSQQLALQCFAPWFLATWTCWSVLHTSLIVHNTLHSSLRLLLLVRLLLLFYQCIKHQVSYCRLQQVDRLHCFHLWLPHHWATAQVLWQHQSSVPCCWKHQHPRRRSCLWCPKHVHGGIACLSAVCSCWCT